MADNHESILKFYGHILLQKNQGLENRGKLYGTCETRECPQRNKPAFGGPDDKKV